jgi:catechol 2,3-dioxygenase-like lactoylglutathione lyase family enzyme
MKISSMLFVLDTADLTTLSSFWADMLGGTVKVYADNHTVSVDGELRLAVQLAPNHVQPDWPDGVQQQVHLDLWVDDIQAAHEEALSLGARLLKSADDPAAVHGFHVYADPAGHPFCLIWG